LIFKFWFSSFDFQVLIFDFQVLIFKFWFSSFDFQVLIFDLPNVETDKLGWSTVLIGKILADTERSTRGEEENFRDNNIGGTKMPFYFPYEGIIVPPILFPLTKSLKGQFISSSLRSLQIKKVWSCRKYFELYGIPNIF
jgi:hypothetical protein